MSLFKHLFEFLGKLLDQPDKDYQIMMIIVIFMFMVFLFLVFGSLDVNYHSVP